MSLLPTQKRIFNEIWFNEAHDTTFELKKRRGGKTYGAVATQVVLALTAAGWLNPTSPKIKRLVDQHHGKNGKKPVIGDPFQMAFFNYADRQATGHVMRTIKRYLERLPKNLRDKFSEYHKKEKYFLIEGKYPGWEVYWDVAGVGRTIDSVRGSGYNFIQLDEAQKFLCDDIETALGITLAERKGLLHLMATANIHENPRETWKWVSSMPTGKVFRTTAKDCIVDAPYYGKEQYKSDLDRYGQGNEDHPRWQAEFMCNLDVPMSMSLLSGWFPEEYDDADIDVTSTPYLLGVDIGVDPYTVQKFFIVDEKLVYAGMREYFKEKAKLPEIIRDTVSPNCVCVCLPHDARKYNEVNGETHIGTWMDLANVDIVYVPKHDFEANRIAETNRYIHDVHKYVPDVRYKEDVQHLISARYASTDAKYRSGTRIIHPNKYKHAYDAFSTGVIGYFGKYKNKEVDYNRLAEVLNTEPEPYAGLMDDRHDKSFEHLRAEYMDIIGREEVEREENEKNYIKEWENLLFGD